MRYNTGIKIFFVLLIACPHKDRVRVKDKKRRLEALSGDGVERIRTSVLDV